MMTLREVKFTEKALEDLYELDYTIRYNFQAPLTAERYLTGLKQEIQELTRSADLSVVQRKLSQKYGIEIRRVNYKGMAILYSIEEEVVIIQRIIPQNMVIF